MELDELWQGATDILETDNEIASVNIQQHMWRPPSPGVWNRKIRADPGFNRKSRVLNSGRVTPPVWSPN